MVGVLGFCWGREIHPPALRAPPSKRGTEPAEVGELTVPLRTPSATAVGETARWQSTSRAAFQGCFCVEMARWRNCVLTSLQGCFEQGTSVTLALGGGHTLLLQAIDDHIDVPKIDMLGHLFGDHIGVGNFFILDIGAHYVFY
ncbi:hypothetical protein SAMN04488513_102690 [Pseudozobellia thermophila]|uniref:Uncharacterized protein n=1 Tax=Pseudozobellia thermophila TaxID=192903 RepID=A0A1M6G5W5_9FLAO|nr:hypothetical protein SAMN04488513_102690 [Pseudozobellia thermophila]